VLYKRLTGKRAFQGDTITGILLTIMRGSFDLESRIAVMAWRQAS